MNPANRLQASARLIWATRGLSIAALATTWSTAFVACTDRSSSKNDESITGSGGGDKQSVAGASGTSDADDDELSPVIRRSERGAGCVAQNDCSVEESCVRGKCQPARFGIEATGKECFRIDCATTADCCRGKSADEVPDKCKPKVARCSPQLPGCSEAACDRAADCGGGGSCVGQCGVTQGECRGTADCIENICENGTCTLDFQTCSSDAECTLNSCLGGQCACDNPSYDPADPVCEDPECEDMCLYACEDSRCVIPSDCASNDECFGTTALCDDGHCVECTSRNDCTFGKICLEGRCETPCASDLNCPLFEACQAGECIYVGCRSDRECSLLPANNAIGLGDVDQRLLRCTTIDGIGRCILPCQNDGQCPPTEVCSEGVCEYIGCETASECKTILRSFGQEVDTDLPWTTQLECR